MEGSTTTVKASLRLQADRAPLSSADEWDIGMALANAEVRKQVSKVLDILLGEDSVVAIDTVLTNVCQPKLCAEVEIAIEFVRNPQATESPLVMSHLVLGTLRHWLTENEDMYSYFYDAKVSWLAPDAMAIPIGWFFQGLSSEMTSVEEATFAVKTREFINSILDQSHSYDKVVVLNQFVNENSVLEVHASLLGSTNVESVAAFQDITLGIFNEESSSFIGSLEAEDLFFDSSGASAFALDEKEVAFNYARTPDLSSDTDVSYRKLDLFDTTRAAIAMVCVFVGILSIGGFVVLLRKRRLQSQASQAGNKLQAKQSHNEDESKANTSDNDSV